MTLFNKLSQIKTIFHDTAPIIYFIEAHPKFGPLTMGVVEAFQTGKINAFSSVLTLTEVLSKPIETEDQRFAKLLMLFRYLQLSILGLMHFLRMMKNLNR